MYKRQAEILALTPLLDRYPRQLSGGQRQRVAMGRAIVRDPQVFLFDEPLSNLDAKLRVQMRGEIKALHQRLGTTTIYVTHDQIEAMTMADKIVVLHDGLVEQIGAPLDLYDRPANLFVAGFIGSPAMNFVRGHVEEGVFRSSGGLTLPLPEGINLANIPGGDLIYGIRPEHIRATTAGGIPGSIVLLEATGSEIFARVDCAGEEISCLFRERLALKQSEQMRIELMRLHESLATTMIYVTHDQIEAMTMADKIVVLNAGRIEQVGSPMELYHRPNNLFVAGFIGSPRMNLVTGAPAAAFNATTIGSRPEHIAISKTDGQWKGTVGVAEHLGADTFVHVHTDQAGTVTVRAPGDFDIKFDDKVFLTPDAARIHKFDANGLAIR